MLLELLRRGQELRIGKVHDHDIDFIVRQGDFQEYYQVALSVRDESILERELKPLCMAKDSYPKFLLTLDDDPPADYNGIRRLNVLDWLAAP